MVLRPAGRNRGIFFRRTDLSGGCDTVDASVKNVCSTRFATTLESPEGVRVATVEHLMAALCLAGIDNVQVDLSAPEVPAMDGSAAGFLGGVEDTGYAMLPGDPVSVICPAFPLSVSADGGRKIDFFPLCGRILEVSVDFPDSLIGRQSVRLDLDSPADRNRIAQARTFCMAADIPALRAAGLGAGGSADNTLVVEGDCLRGGAVLRDPSEFVLHKALDLVGDLYLLGAPVSGLVRAEKSGHMLNVEMAGKISACMHPGGDEPVETADPAPGCSAPSRV